MHTELILGFVGVAAAVFGGQGFWTWLSNRGRKKSNEAKLLMGLAYRAIIDSATMYINQGWISADDYHELYHYLYEPYEGMGGNGTAKRMMMQVSDLPSEKPKTMSCTGTTVQEGE